MTDGKRKNTLRTGSSNSHDTEGSPSAYIRTRCPGVFGLTTEIIKTTQIYARITDQKIAGDMDDLAAKIGGQHDTPPEPSAMSKRITVKARRQAVEIPTFRMVSGL